MDIAFDLAEPIKGHIGKEHYKVDIIWRNGVLIADEPAVVGGKDLGPDPYTLLLSSLAACTLSTLRMYIDRKGWQFEEINISLNMYQNKEGELSTTIIRDIDFSNDVKEEQKERLLLIASKCPISKILKNKIEIQTILD